jgi:hypothetical protein
MKDNKLSAFHGQNEEKQFYVNEVREWLKRRMPRSPFDIAREINTQVKTYKPSDCILENYEVYPDKLGLPIWLANLFYTIQHYNSKEFDGSENNFEKSFYLQFLSACNVGVDYTPMYHKWQLRLLTDFLPPKERENQNIKSVIKLHEKAISGKKLNSNEWLSESNELERIMKSIDEYTGVTDEIEQKEKNALEKLIPIVGTESTNFKRDHAEWFHLIKIRKAFGQVTWCSLRAAYLSIQGAINKDSEFSSAEAILDATWEEALITGIATSNNEIEIRQKTWKEIIDKLLIMLLDWK